MPDTLYFASGSEGRWELSDGEKQIGHIEQVGLEFMIRPAAGSILEAMQNLSYPSKQEAVEAIEMHTGAMCMPLAQ